MKGYVRIILLQRSGFASKDIDNAMREAERTQKLREQSIANMHWDLLTSGMESLGHKLKKRARLLKKGVPRTSKNDRPAASRTKKRTTSNNNECLMVVSSMAV
jgi:hypothetical protein